VVAQNPFLAVNPIETALRSCIIEMLSKIKLGGLGKILGLMGRLDCFVLVKFFAKCD
jgi:hypothetical protein